MQSSRKSLFILLVLATMLATAFSSAEEAATEVMEVIVIDPQNASETYLATFQKFTAYYKKAGIPATRRMWNNVYAGDETGLVIVTISWPNMMAYAKSDELFNTPEFQALGQEFQDRGFRITSQKMVFSAD